MGKNMSQKYNLTLAQQSVLFEYDANGNTTCSDKNFIWGHAKINQKIDFKRLNEAINYFVKKNDSIRIKLCSENNQFLQYIEEYKKFDIEIMDVNSQEDVKKLEYEVINKPLNMFDSFLFHLTAYRYKNGYGGIIVKLHHIISDGYSLGLLLYEVFGYYNKSLTKYPSFSYIDHIESDEKYFSSKKYEEDKEYWNSLFEKRIPDIAYIPSKKENYSLTLSDKAEFELDTNLVDLIKKYCKKTNTSIQTFFASIYAIYVNKVSNLTNFFLSSISQNRRNFKEKLTSGMYTSTAYFNINIHNESFKEFTKEMNSIIFNAYKHMNFTEYYLRELFDKKNDKRIIPSNIIFSYQDLSTIKNKININCELIGDSSVGTYGLDLFMIHILEQENNKITISYDYLYEKYSKEDVLNVNKGVLNIIKQVINNENISIQDIEI